MAEAQRYKRILIPLDGSGWAKRAVPHAVGIARDNAAELILLHVFKSPVSEYIDQLTLAGQEQQVDHLRHQMEQYLTGVRAQLEREYEGLEIKIQWIEGEAVPDAICDYVRSEKVDLVVMSTHGRTGLARLIYGNVAAEIIKSIRTPIMLIYPDEND
jgi:nucleotide-binding universal stress UspA family protein